MVGERSSEVEEEEKKKSTWKIEKGRETVRISSSSSSSSLWGKSGGNFLNRRKKKKYPYSPSSMEALALCTSLSTVFLNSFDSLIRICALNTSPNFGFPSNAIFSSAVRSSGCFISAATAIPASAENRSHALADQKKFHPIFQKNSTIAEFMVETYGKKSKLERVAALSFVDLKNKSVERARFIEYSKKCKEDQFLRSRLFINYTRV